jgi:hypothetical protein
MKFNDLSNLLALTHTTIDSVKPSAPHWQVGRQQEKEGEMNKVKEFVLVGLDSAGREKGLDLDGLSLMTRPEAINSWPPNRRAKWLLESGYDLSVDFDGKKMWVHGVNANIVVVASSMWDEADLSWVTRTLQTGDKSSALVL